jgi:glycosyltransferase involved in cell wall biosynthesis
MALDAIVVIPARDEEARIAACLQALAAQTISSFETIVVLDACADSTERVTTRAAERLGLEGARRLGNASLGAFRPRLLSFLKAA